jgi:signal transduction histidine kinase
MENRKGYYQNILENMNSGFLCISRDRVKFINKTLISNLNLKKLYSFKSSDRDGSKIANLCEQEILCENDIQIMLEELLDGIELNYYIKENNIDNLPIVELILSYLKTNSSPKFSVIGTNNYKISENISVYYEISARCYRTSYNHDEFIEFIFNDVSNIKISEESAAEFKYKTMFLSKVAHEFKNPILCITELVDQVNERVVEIKEDTDKLAEKFISITDTLRSIKSMSNYLIILIKDMDFFSIKNQNISIIKLEKDLVLMDSFINFIKDITNILIKKFDKQEQITFKIEQTSLLPNKIYTDELRLKQILINLLSNSVKYTLNGTITLEILYEKNKMTFIIKDTGIGIPENKKSSLFQPYMPTSKNYTNISAGLGLFIVKEILDLFGSTIIYEPNEPAGSKFTFSIDVTSHVSSSEVYKNRSNKFLSLKSIKHEGLLSCSSQRSKKTVVMDFQPRVLSPFKSLFYKTNTSFALSPRGFSDDSSNIIESQEPEFIGNIIVADDEGMTRKSTVRMITNYCKFEGKNINILEAGDGIECLSLYYDSIKKGEKIAMIISDQTMSFLNGSACAKILHDLNTDKGLQDVPFFILTAYERFALDSGIKGSYTKPLMNKHIEEIFYSININ